MLFGFVTFFVLILKLAFKRVYFVTTKGPAIYLNYMFNLTSYKAISVQMLLLDCYQNYNLERYRTYFQQKIQLSKNDSLTSSTQKSQI